MSLILSWMYTGFNPALGNYLLQSRSGSLFGLILFWRFSGFNPVMEMSYV